MLKLVLLLSLVALATCAFLPGGYEDVEEDDEDILEVANYVVKGVSRSIYGTYHHKIVKILKAKRQVVAGTNYKLELIIGKTNCKKDEVEFEDAADCDLQDDDNTYVKCNIFTFRNLKGRYPTTSSACSSISKDEVEKEDESVEDNKEEDNNDITI